MIEELKKFIEEIGIEHFSRLLRNRKPEIFEWLMQQTIALDNDVKMTERVFYVFNGDCRFCSYGNKRKFYSFSLGYKCSAKCKCVRDAIEKTSVERYGSKCSLQNEEVKQKIKETNIEIYGCENVSNSILVQNKREKTNLERYGTSCSLLNIAVKEKTKKTNLKKYGCEIAAQSSLIEKKRKLTNSKRYGKTNVLMSDDIKERVKQTNLERYGFEVALQNPIIHEKTKNTHEKRYGVRHPSQRAEIREKINNTVMERYGVDSFSKKHMSEMAADILYDKELFMAFCKDKSVNKIAIELRVSESFVNKKFNEFNVMRSIKWQQENEVLLFLNSLGIIWKKDRNLIKPFEIDFLCSEHKIGIEYCGLFWHSDIHGRDKKYHLNKTLMAETQGHRLVHIFEDEWLLKQEIVKSRLKNILGMSEKGALWSIL